MAETSAPCELGAKGTSVDGELDNPNMPPSWAVAAAAFAQWIWVQVLLEDVQADVGILEKCLLLQPQLARRRLERAQKTLSAKVVALGSSKFYNDLWKEVRERSFVPVETLLVRASTPQTSVASASSCKRNSVPMASLAWPPPWLPLPPGEIVAQAHDHASPRHSPSS